MRKPITWRRTKPLTCQLCDEPLETAATAPSNIFAKFVIERQDTDKMEAFRLAS
jgi:hypothetical protein